MNINKPTFEELYEMIKANFKPEAVPSNLSNFKLWCKPNEYYYCYGEPHHRSTGKGPSGKVIMIYFTDYDCYMIYHCSDFKSECSSRSLSVDYQRLLAKNNKDNPIFLEELHTAITNERVFRNFNCEQMIHRASTSPAEKEKYQKQIQENNEMTKKICAYVFGRPFTKQTLTENPLLKKSPKNRLGKEKDN